MDEQQRDESPAADLVVHVQDAMLPKSLPVPQGAIVAARYVIADDVAAAGGDWFDVIVLDDGCVVACVGDVSGSGPEAAVVMGKLRTVFDDRVREDGDLARALAALDRRTAWTPETRGTTVCALLLDPTSGRLTYCTAGHPPPVIVAASGRTTELETTGAAALGAADGRFPTATHQLAPGDIALLYTDGLVERPGRTPAQGTAELMQAVADATTGPTTGEPIVDRICRETLEVLTRSSGYRDDVAVLAVQRVGATAPLHLVLPAVPDATRAARADLGEWLARLHVTALDDLSVRHAISELVANAVDHAYDDPGVDDQVRVDARLRPDGVLEAQVADDGAWREPAVTGQARGRGLAIVAGFVDELQLNRGPAGTRATVRHRLRRPAMMLRGYVEERAGAPGPPEFRVHVDDTRLRASGHVGDEAALKLQRLLDRCSQGGTRPIEVDLADVSLLGSAGVQVLVEARAAGEVRLFAPRGSAAQHVLDLVQVPYES